MGLPALFTPDRRLNDAYFHALYAVQLALMLFVVYWRTNSLREPRGIRGVKPPGQPAVLFIFRLPHLVCCLSLVAMHICVIYADASIVDQDRPWSDSATKAFYTAMNVCATAMWALCAGLVIAEQRNQRHSGRLLRLWWCFHLLIASTSFASAVIRFVQQTEALDNSLRPWTIARMAAFVPSLWLGLIGLFAPDTPQGNGRVAPYLSSTGSSYSEGLLPAPNGTTQGMLTQPLAPPPPEAPSEATPPPSAEASASFASQLTFSYMSGLLGLGRKRALEHHDLFDLDYGDASYANEKAFQEALDQGGSFLRCWHRAYGQYFWMTGVLQLLNTACTFANPLLLHEIVKYVNRPESTGYDAATAVMLAVGMMLANCAKSLILGQYFWRGFRLGLRTRAAVGQAVYAKALGLAHEQRQHFGTGSIVSFMQIDAQKMADALPYMHLLWQGPIQLAIATYMLYEFMGPAGLAGLGVMVISTPLNTWVSKQTQKYTKRTMKARDARVKYTNELLQGMKILKLFAWEPAMLEQLHGKREDELVAVKNNMLMGGVLGFIFTALPLVVTAASFAIFAIPGVGKRTPDNPEGHLTAAIAYTALALFQVMRFPLLIVPMMITRLMDILVINGRLTKFLQAPNRPVYRLTGPTASGGGGGGGGYEPFTAPLVTASAIYHEPTAVSAGEAAIEVTKATFKWPEPKAEDKDKGKKKGGGGGGSNNGSVRGGSNGRAAASGGATTERQQLTAGITSSTASDGVEKPVLPPTLVDLSLKLPQGGLVGIGGPVGSGKSTLLSALVGDVPMLEGRVVVRGSMALCTQEPWIQNQTVRENILFGLPYDAAFYARVLSACALESDLQQLAGGDATEIGERGVNLSGGQKARVALARACYARASIVLLDDVLSAVDAEVGAHLIQHCISGLLKEKGALVVFVTHHTHWLHECDHVLLFNDDGTVKAQGPPTTISALPRVSSSGKLSGSSSVGSGLDAAGAPSSANGAGGSAGKVLTAEPITPGTARAAKMLDEQAAKQTAQKAKGKQMSDEDRERGTVSRSVWITYARALGACMTTVGIFGMSIISQAAQFGSSFWLGIWAGDTPPNTTAVPPEKGSIFHEISGGQPWFYLGIYCALAVVAACAILVRSFVTAYASVAAGRKIHDKAVLAVFGSPMSFFDVTPVGRILNRFSGDVQKVDVQLASSLAQFVQYAVSLLCTLVVLVINSPFVLIALPPLSIMYLINSSYYRNSAREVQRLDSISKSPIYAAFQEALNGATSIQAYGCNERFEEVNRQKVDYNLRANYISLAANRWLTVRLEFFSNILLFLTALLAVIETINAGSATSAEERQAAAVRATAAGLALTYAPGLTDTLNFLIRQLTLLETQMVSVERLENYSHLSAEGGGRARPVQPTWPALGAIVFRDVKMGYRPGLPDVLKGMDLSVSAGEQIGIVGRTGAGKSSILICLYQLADLRAGSIEIDGVDIAAVPLPALRSRLAIIPQDPVLFTGTLRSNLDPTSEHTDEMLWSSLRQAGMEAAMAQHPDKLERPIEERGGNLSMGQRQLLCLCRALLKRARILVLDEATASVDMESDALIQQTLQHQMGGTTVLTIAHRLETIMHCNRVVVMHEGRVAENGPPMQLKDTPGSRFAELWESRNNPGS